MRDYSIVYCSATQSCPYAHSLTVLRMLCLVGECIPYFIKPTHCAAAHVVNSNKSNMHGVAEEEMEKSERKNGEEETIGNNSCEDF